MNDFDHVPDPIGEDTNPGKRSAALRIITNSEMKAERRCRRYHYYRYVLGVISLAVSDALKLGTLVHLGLEAWWLSVKADPAGDHLTAALMAVGDESDPFVRIKAEVMLFGYHERWHVEAEGFEVIGVELQFVAPLVNPDTGKPSRTFQVAGKLDVMVRDVAGAYVPAGDLAFIEHKSSIEDIAAGARYWRRLRVDSQIGVYFGGAEAITEILQDPDAPTANVIGGCIYDVLKKPTSKPSRATPADKRKYTQPKFKQCPECKKKGAPPAPHAVPTEGGETFQCIDDPEGGSKRIVCTDAGGRLYATMRENDEAPEEYRVRIMAELVQGDALAASFMRDAVVRTTGELEEARRDLWQQAATMRENDTNGRHPRNPDACFLYGRECEYVEVCAGVADIDDPTKFKRVDDPHVELTPAVTE